MTPAELQDRRDPANGRPRPVVRSAPTVLGRLHRSAGVLVLAVGALALVATA